MYISKDNFDKILVKCDCYKSHSQITSLTKQIIEIIKMALISGHVSAFKMAFISGHVSAFVLSKLVRNHNFFNLTVEHNAFLTLKFHLNLLFPILRHILNIVYKLKKFHNHMAY